MKDAHLSDFFLLVLPFYHGTTVRLLFRFLVICTRAITVCNYLPVWYLVMPYLGNLRPAGRQREMLHVDLLPVTPATS